MAAHSSIHAWRIPWTEELGWPRSIGLQRVRHDLAHHTHNTATANISCLHIGRLIHGAVFLCTEDTHVSVVVFFSPSVQFSSVQLLSHVRLFVTLWTAARQVSLSITNTRSLLKLMSIELVMPSNHLILCRPLLLLPSVFPSIRVFSNESALHIRWPKYWGFSFSISPSNEYSGLVSFGIDWLDLLAVQGTLKSLLQHHSSKASVLQCSALFMVQLSPPDMTTGKITALTRRTFVGKVMPLL